MMMAETYNLELNPSPTPQQLMVRNAWLGVKENKAQTESKLVPASPQDVTTVDQVVKALYDVISGPAGTRNWDRFRSLFYPGAYMGAMVTMPNGETTLRKFSPEEYIKNNSPMFEKFGFREKEIGRDENVYGNIAQVFTAYEFTLDMPTPVKERGINSIELIQQDGRWWVTSIIWSGETKENPIPAKYLTPGKK